MILTKEQEEIAERNGWTLASFESPEEFVENLQYEIDMRYHCNAEDTTFGVTWRRMWEPTCNEKCMCNLVFTKDLTNEKK